MNPTVANDTARFQKLMKEQSDLQPIADAYQNIKTADRQWKDSLMMLDENQTEMREMLGRAFRRKEARIELGRS